MQFDPFCLLREMNNAFRWSARNGLGPFGKAQPKASDNHTNKSKNQITFEAYALTQMV
jgi:hypothetical protein